MATALLIDADLRAQPCEEMRVAASCRAGLGGRAPEAPGLG